MPKLTKKQNDSIESILEHFHPEAINYGGWPIWVRPENVDIEFLKKEFDGIVEFYDDGGGRYPMVRLVEGAKFRPDHTIRVLRYKAELYREEANKYYDGMKKLIGA